LNTTAIEACTGYEEFTPERSVGARAKRWPNGSINAAWSSPRRPPPGGQTGGPDKEPVAGSTHRRCNTRLKNAVLQAVQKVRQYGPADLRKTAPRLEEQGSHVEFARAKRRLRLGEWLALNQTVYRPKALKATNATAPIFLLDFCEFSCTSSVINV
jgi:hypothetical protein